MSLFVHALLESLLLAKATSISHHSQLKSLHFALYQHETINKTGYIVINGVAGTGLTQTTTSFGTHFVFQDPMTVTANRSSKVAGKAQGTSITSSLDGLESISIGKITLRLKHHRGSISIVGGTHNIKPADHPVVSGTGDFKLVQGHVTSSPVDHYNGLNCYLQDCIPPLLASLCNSSFLILEDHTYRKDFVINTPLITINTPRTHFFSHILRCGSHNPPLT